MKKKSVSYGAVDKAVQALLKAGATGEDFELIANRAASVLAFSQIDASTFVDTSVAWVSPDGCSVESHTPGATVDVRKITLHFDPGQMDGESIKGTELRKLLEGQPVLNACVLDHLLDHPEQIPEDWKGKDIFFWGTIYRDSDGRQYVRCLCWSGDAWFWRSCRLEGGWDDGSPAALTASI